MTQKNKKSHKVHLKQRKWYDFTRALNGFITRVLNELLGSEVSPY